MPWELMARQRDFYDKLVVMEAGLEEQAKKSDHGWSCTPPSPNPSNMFPFFNEEPDPKHHPGVSRILMLVSGSYMGEKLIVPKDNRGEEQIRSTRIEGIKQSSPSLKASPFVGHSLPVLVLPRVRP